jgi:riboflavin kinase/FMN adenylyltransferase
MTAPSFTILRDPDEAAVRAAVGPRRPVYAVGNFDGVHRGHQALFAQARRMAHRLDGTAAALTFDPHPARFLKPDLAPPLLMPLHRRLDLIAAEGIALAIVLRFDAALAATSPADFVHEVLARRLYAAGLVVGADFSFGARRAGTTDTLRDLAPEAGLAVSIVQPVRVDDIVASSTKVREFVLEGRVDGARLLMGRPFDLAGEVVTGAGRGRTIGIPTANLRADGELWPRLGVYVGEAFVAGGRYGAAINVGVAPTFGDENPVAVEAHLLDFTGDLVGAPLRLAFWRRLRDERRFTSRDALIAQIQADVATARALYAAGLPPLVGDAT